MPNQPLTLSVKESPAHVEVSVLGRMDAEAVRQITEEFDRATFVHRPVIVDLTGVTFLESLGVALIVRLAKRLKEEKLPMAVIPGNGGSVGRILTIARLDRILNVVPSLEAARRAVGAA